MSLVAFVAQVQKTASAVFGVTVNRVAVPQSLNAADLPCAAVLVQPATWGMATTGWNQQLRDVVIRFYVAPVNAGIIPDEGYSATLALIDQAGQAFVNNRDLNKAGPFVEPQSFSDTGPQVFPVAETGYWGFDLRFKINEAYALAPDWIPSAPLLDRAYADGDVTGEAHT